MFEGKVQDFEEGVSLREAVCGVLRVAILTGELEAGERLMEIPLAEQMGVSRTPVREAIRRLEEEGLVIITPKCGAPCRYDRGSLLSRRFKGYCI